MVQASNLMLNEIKEWQDLIEAKYSGKHHENAELDECLIKMIAAFSTTMTLRIRDGEAFDLEAAKALASLVIIACDATATSVRRIEFGMP